MRLTITEAKNEIEVYTVKKIYDFLERTKAKTVIVYGGAGSGKSYTVSQFLIFERALKFTHTRILITRKYNPSLTKTSFKLFIELLEMYRIPYKLHKVEQFIVLPNRSEIYFTGMDNPEKIKSSEYNYIWMEEATEFNVEDYQQLRLRLRRANHYTRNQIYLTFNPIGKTNWVYSHFFEQQQPDVDILHSNYLDNPFLDKDYVELLLRLEQQDERFYKIYTLGEFAEISNIIYNNYQILDKLPEEYDIIIYGIDFGYNNPTAVLKIGLKDRNIYIIDEIYKTHLTNKDLIEHLRGFVHSPTAPIYADSAEPNRIQEIYEAGFNIYPSNKSVKDGIDYVKRHKIYINKKCTNTIKEIQNYKWREDKDGNVLDEPVKFLDHAMDALRYAVYTHSEDKSLRGFNLDII